MAKKTMTLELPDDNTPQEVQNLTKVLENKIEDLIYTDVIGFKKIESKLTETNSQESINKLGEVFSIGIGRATKAITGVERAVRSSEETEQTETLLPTLSEIQKEEQKQHTVLLEIQKNTKEKQEFPTTPENPVSVRLSDGTRWIEDLVKVVSSGGGSSRLQFKKANGEEVQALADADGRVIVRQTASTGTLSNVSGSASSVTILAANTNRVGAGVTNDSSAHLYVKLGSVATTSSYTVVLGGRSTAPFSYFEVPSGYTGVITGIWDSATGTARVTEIT